MLESLANTTPVSPSSSESLNVWREPASRLPVAELLALARWRGRAEILKGLSDSALDEEGRDIGVGRRTVNETGCMLVFRSELVDLSAEPS